MPFSQHLSQVGPPLSERRWPSDLALWPDLESALSGLRAVSVPHLGPRWSCRQEDVAVPPS